MKHSKLGISVGLLGASVYFLGLVSGYLAVILLSGYILLFEENDWLKKTAVKAVGIMLTFSLLIAAIGLIPDIVYFIDDVFEIFGGYFGISFLTSLATAIISAVTILEKVVLIISGIRAIHQSSLPFPFVDYLIEKHMG